MLLALLSTSTPLLAAIPSAERAALIDLYNSTNGSGWKDHTGWLGALGTECNWYGIRCSSDATGLHVFDISLRQNQLNGRIPASLGQLTNLQRLFLDSNQLSGSIPDSLGQLTNLQHLHLDSNQLRGSIPDSLGQLTNLQFLDLYSNNCLTTDNAELVTFIDRFNKSWKTSQGKDCPFPADNSKQATATTFSATPEAGLAPLRVALDATGLPVANAQSAQYVWRSSDGQTASGKTAVFNFTQAGVYDILLTVTENGVVTLSRNKRILATPETQLASASFTEPTNTSQQAAPLLVNDNPTLQTLDAVDSEDWFEFYAVAGKRYTILIPANSIGKNINPAFQLFDKTGKPLSDLITRTVNGQGVSLQVTASVTDLYRIRVTNQAPFAKISEVDNQYQLRVFLTDEPQQGIVKGFVTNSCSRRGIGGAEVSSLLGGSINDSTVTFRSGEFGLPLNPNTYQLKSTATNFQEQTLSPVRVGVSAITRVQLDQTPNGGCANNTVPDLDSDQQQQQAVAVYNETTGSLIIRDVWAGKFVVYAELQDIGNYRFQLTRVLEIPGPIHTLPGDYDFATAIAN